MKRIARLLGLFSILLLLFVAALAVSQRVLHQQSQRLRDEAITRKQSQLAGALELAGLGAPPWSDTTMEALARTLDAQLHFETTPKASGQDPQAWRFTHQFGPAASGSTLTVTFAPPPAARLLDTYQRMAGVLFSLALAAIVVLVTFMLWSIRSRDADHETGTGGSERTTADFEGLRQLANVSARQSTELEVERTARLQIEENLHVKQLLLNHALEQKIQLGQDLHDGIIQSLYATGLNLEAIRTQIATDPAAAAERLHAVTQGLNTTIREVRGYIHGLSPDQLRTQTFPEAVSVLTRELAAGRGVDFSLEIDSSTAAGLPEGLRTDLLQIVREAVSNSLRHGQATQVVISLTGNAGSPQVRISDNGCGFDPPSGDRARGHGLQNMEARIQSHGGTVSIESAPGRGTVLVFRLPAYEARSV